MIKARVKVLNKNNIPWLQSQIRILEEKTTTQKSTIEKNNLEIEKQRETIANLHNSLIKKEDALQTNFVTNLFISTAIGITTASIYYYYYQQNFS